METIHKIKDNNFSTWEALIEDYLKEVKKIIELKLLKIK